LKVKNYEENFFELFLKRKKQDSSMIILILSNTQFTNQTPRSAGLLNNPIESEFSFFSKKTKKCGNLSSNVGRIDKWKKQL